MALDILIGVALVLGIIILVIGVSLMMMGLACRAAAFPGGTDPAQLRRATIVTAPEMSCASMWRCITS